MRASKVGGSCFTLWTLMILMAGFFESQRSLCVSASRLSVPKMRYSFKAMLALSLLGSDWT